jgi:hypothetical protein
MGGSPSDTQSTLRPGGLTPTTVYPPQQFLIYLAASVFSVEAGIWLRMDKLVQCCTSALSQHSHNRIYIAKNSYITSFVAHVSRLIHMYPQSTVSIDVLCLTHKDLPIINMFWIILQEHPTNIVVPHRLSGYTESSATSYHSKTKVKY